MTGRDIVTVAQARENYVQSLDIKINKSQLNGNFIEQFTQVLSPYKEGTCPVRVFYQRADAQGMMTLGVQWRVTPDDELIHQLNVLLGDDSVSLQFK